MIFDNVEKSEDLDQFWPTGGNGKIIVTTRHPGVGYQLTDDEIPVSPFTPEEGRECILSLASWPGGVPPDADAAQELSEELGGLAIGIIQMTALMRARRTPIDKFLKDYRRNKLRYHGRDAEGATSIYPPMKPKIATNWTMSFNALSHDAQYLLGVLSFLSSDAIPQHLFKHWDESPSRNTQGLLPFCDDPDE